jgi:ABC-type nitrate/sulfonate/bicarbonate transport system ATPase subunit
MAPYSDLMRTLDDLRKRTSRFRRVALHLHSPDSHDWNKTGDKAINDRTKLLAPGGEMDFIAALKPHFDLVVITDHMKCSYASRVSKATLVDDGFRVLPGMEVNFRPEAAMTTMRLHLLTILPATHFNPITLVRALLGGDPAHVAGKHPAGEPSSQITTVEAQKAMEAWKPWIRDEPAQVDWLQDDGDRLRGLMELQEVEWDDHESILLNDRPVGELSPGQRSSAMLPLIALAEPTPLVIDQPEDNLDNRLVGQVLTNILAWLKERRQIIVCTHNPNIVVSGDAEQVIVLDALSDRKGGVLRHGSIDNDDIVQSVIEIMEGGAEAFHARQQRYGF